MIRDGAPPAHSGDDARASLLTAVVEHVLYHREDTLYTVMRVKSSDEGGRSFTVVAHVANPAKGDMYRFTGTWVTHPTYGLQFSAALSEYCPPITEEGIIAYLAGEIEEIGPELACRIVKTFGSSALTVIEEAPERLREVAGIGPKRLDAIKRAWRSKRRDHETLLFLYGQGIGHGLAMKIMNRYGDAAAEIIRKNPYRLALEVAGIGFATADRIAKRTGIPADAPGRVTAGVLWVLSSATARGHTYLPRRVLLREASNLLGVDDDSVDSAAAALETEGRIAVEAHPGGSAREDAVYLASLLHAEREAARKLSALSSAAASVTLLDPLKAIDWMERARSITLSGGQKEAVIRSASSTCMVITGGPGTGKTSTITAIIHLFDRSGAKVALCAPTGRAARRMKEATGYDALTIHRLLEYNPGDDSFARNEKNPLDADLLIVDEFSMVDVLLLWRLLDAVRPGTTLVFVGDADQLPSVGPGDCLREIISSGKADVVRLERVYRQDHAGAIAENCHRIKIGLMPVGASDLGAEYVFIPEEDPERILERVLGLVTREIPSRYGLDPVRDIQVLSPMHKGVLGVENLNKRLQDLLNPARNVQGLAGGAFRKGDKVMQTRNNYNLEVFNGDVGTLVDVDTRSGVLVVAYEDRFVTYSAADAQDLAIAYAVTIHKAQGSEYGSVVLPLHTQHAVMLARNLLYTAVSRGKRLVVTIGHPKAFELAVKNNRSSSRFSGFATRLSLPR